MPESPESPPAAPSVLDFAKELLAEARKESAAHYKRNDSADALPLEIERKFYSAAALAAEATTAESFLVTDLKIIGTVEAALELCAARNATDPALDIQPLIETEPPGHDFWKVIESLEEALSKTGPEKVPKLESFAELVEQGLNKDQLRQTTGFTPWQVADELANPGSNGLPTDPDQFPVRVQERADRINSALALVPRAKAARELAKKLRASKFID